MNNGVDRKNNISRSINDCRGIACANTESRFAGRISGFYHARTAGCKDNVGFLHQGIGKLQRRNIHPADNALWCACGNSSFQYNLSGSNGAFLCTRVWADNNSVTCF